MDNDIIPIEQLPKDDDIVPVSQLPSKPSAQTDAPIWKPVMDYLGGSQQRAEQRISQRPSMIASVNQDPPTLQRYAAHPLGTALRSLGYWSEAAQAVPSDILMALGRGKPKDIIPDIEKTFQGKRASEYGDYLTQGGFPEPAAALGGLLMSAMNPEGVVGEEASLGTKAAMSAINPPAALGTAMFSPATEAMNGLLKTVGRPVASQTMRFFTGGHISADAAERALDNPKILSPQFLKTEGEQVGKLYDEVIEPLRQDPKTLVKFDNTLAALDKNKLSFNSTPIAYQTTKFGQAVEDQNFVPSYMKKMTDSEQNKVFGWLNDLKGRIGSKGGASYNDTEGMINDMDKSLKKFYTKKAKEAMTGEDYPSVQFDRVTNILRRNLSQDLKEAYPDAAPVIKAAEEHAKNIEAANKFQGINVGFLKSLPLRLALLGGGIPTRGASLLALPATAPAAWKYGIQAGSSVSNAIKSNPALLAPLLRAGQNKDEE